MNVVSGMIPTKYLIPGAALGAINKRVFFPAAKKIASKVSVGIGILSEEEARTQEKMFDNLISPINSIIDSLENQVMQILGGGSGILETLVSWVENKERNKNPVQIEIKETDANKKMESSLAKEFDKPTDTGLGNIIKYMKAPKISELQRGSTVSAKNIDMSLFNAMEHAEARSEMQNPSPGAESFGAPVQSLGGRGSVVIPPKRKF